jgi:hypothetical protein
MKKFFNALQGSTDATEEDDIKLKKRSTESQSLSTNNSTQSPSIVLGKPLSELKGIKYSDDVKTPLLLESIVYNVEIIPSAQTFTQSTTMNFKNFSNQKLEGELVFPLPEDAIICGYALQIDDTLVNATVVEKKKAQKTFGEEVLKGNVVSLVEQVAGNQYRTKIYPWNPNSTKTVKLDFYSSLKADSDFLLFDIPVDKVSHEKLNSVTLVINVNEDQEPLVSSEKDLKLTKNEGKFMIELTKDDLENLNVLHVKIPSKGSQKVSVENNVNLETFYFNISENVKILEEEKTLKKESSIAVIWDCSFGRENEVKNFEKKEFLLLNELLQTGTFTIDLHTFSNTMENVGKFTKSNDLLNAIKSLPYDGATNIYQLSSLNLASYDYCLLFTDGIDNLSPMDVSPMKFKSSSPIFCLNSSVNCDQSLMNYIAEVTGGGYFKINEKNLKEIVPKIGSLPFSFLSAEFDENEISDVYPSKPTQIDNDSFNINGVLLSDEATITLNFGFGNTIKDSRKIKLSKKDANISNIIGTLWAKKCLSEMDCFSEHYKEEIISIGRKFSLVTKNTSLMVLETLQQHIEHNITPAKERTQLLQEYTQHMKNETTKQNNIIESKLVQVKSMWRGYMNWYNTDYVSPYLEDLIQRTVQLSKENEMNKDVHEKLTEMQNSFDNKLEESKKKVQEEINKTNAILQKEVEILKEKHEARKLEIEKEIQTRNEFKMNNIKKRTFKDEEKNSMPKLDRMYEKEEKISSNFIKSKKKMSSSHPMMEESMDESSHMEESMSLSSSISSSSSRSRRSDISDQKISSNSDSSSGSIKIQKFNPDVPYLKALNPLKKEEFYKKYLSLRKDYKSSPPFYLDICDFFFKNGLIDESIKILTNLAELEFESPQLIRIMGYKFEELGELNLSSIMFKKVLFMSPHEPQSYRDLAIVLDKLGEHKQAIQYLYKVITGSWSSKFNQIEITALQELNRIVLLRGDFGVKIPKELLDETPLDLRIIMAWDTDNVNISLLFIESLGRH